MLCSAYGVSPELRAKVIASIERLGYRPSTSARAMRGRTFTLGVIASNIHNPFFADVTVGISRKLQGTRYQALLGFSLSSGESEFSLVEAMLDRQVDGIIWIAPRVGKADLMAVARRIPLVLVAYHDPGSEDFDTANVDDEKGARLATLHLAKAGRRRIAMISVHWPGTAGSVILRREQGYLDAMAELGLADEVRIIHSEENASDIGDVAKKLMNGPARPESVFCWNDFAALELLSATRNLGLGVPREVSIVGFDNTSFCQLSQNALSSVDQSAEALGENAAEMVLQRIDGRKEPRHVLTEPKLVVRSSSATIG